MDLTWLNMAFDGLMIMAILALWFMWFQQGKQRHKVEKMLEQASLELQQATQLLEQVMVQFPSLNDQAEANQAAKIQDVVQISASKHHYPPNNHVQQPVQQRQVAPRQVAKPKQVVSASNSSHKSSHSANIMRLKREGLSAETIANQLAIPIAQVRLLLLLQAPKV